MRLLWRGRISGPSARGARKAKQAELELSAALKRGR